ncbi:adhesion G protein-coupled receptor E4P [Biomphalaria pfeifferi]|uniref:Adhesion G protein-coupled receptor E4P n=1 Tax=Biomphalaria pfeifferi TaxID=112525 RepID=A0AAD8EZA0_BIOPF|nr:adhesion G protein-coupled receptor E4P [Biomphalaria pfeifferi]
MRLGLVLNLNFAFIVCFESWMSDLCNFTGDWSEYLNHLSQFQLSVCTLRCNVTDIVDFGKDKYQVLSVYYCSYCICSGPSCKSSKICCPNISAAQPQSQFDVIKVNVSNENKNKRICKLDPELFPEKFRLELDCFINRKLIPIELTCPPDYQDNVTVEYLCEADLLIEERSLDTCIKVLDNATNVVYKNKFCALCNRVSQDFPALTQGDCQHPTYLFKFQNPQRSVWLSFLTDSNLTEENEEHGVRLCQSKCSETEWSAPDGSCLQIHCTDGKQLSDDDVRIEYTLNIMFMLQSQDDYVNWSKFKEHFSRLALLQFFTLQFVNFNLMEYQMTITNTVIPPEVRIAIDLNGTELEITDNKDLIMLNVNKNGRLHVCIDFLDIKLNERYN